MAILMTKEQVMAVIPHRPPFLLIDEVLELTPGERCVAVRHIVQEDFWFQGHFPDFPVTPGVLQIEMMAQAGAVAMLCLPENRGKIGLFAGIDKAKFRTPVLPGDDLRLETTILRRVGQIVMASGVATVNGRQASTAELKFALLKNEEG